METIMQNNTPIQHQLNASALNSLRKSYPWIRFVAIVGIILSGLMIIASLFIMLGFSMADNPLGIMKFGFIGGIYFIMAVILFVPNLFLLNYAHGLRDFTRQGLSESADTAFRQQNYFWTFMGVLIILYLSLIVLAIAFALLTAGFVNSTMI